MVIMSKVWFICKITLCNVVQCQKSKYVIGFKQAPARPKHAPTPTTTCDDSIAGSW